MQGAVSDRTKFRRDQSPPARGEEAIARGAEGWFFPWKDEISPIRSGMTAMDLANDGRSIEGSTWARASGE